MDYNIAEIFTNGLLEGIIPVLKLFLAPIFLWVLLPGIGAQLLFKSRHAYPLGAFVGLIAAVSIGPFS
jgi:hypothetical protein